MLKRQLLFPLVLLLLFCLFQNCQNPASFIIGGNEDTAIWIAPEEPEYVQLAVQDLVSDIQKIIGIQTRIVDNLEHCPGNCIMIGTISDTTVASSLSPDYTSQLQDAWERYAIVFQQDAHSANKLIISGSNPRGTMFGIYHFLRDQLQVDPLYFWTDYSPSTQPNIQIGELTYLSEVPDFKYRGWFINDEDLLTEWKEGGGVRKIDYPYYGQVVAPQVMQQVVEVAIRLGFNLIIPASFVDIRNPAEERLIQEASKRGLFVSMHHIEPMGLSAFGYQNYWEEQGEDPLFSFYSEPEKLKQTWKVYAEKWAAYPDVVWQIGLRGIADRPMWLADPGVPQSDAERGQIISEAMQVQKNIILSVTGDPNPHMTTTLWAEGSIYNQKGYLTIPEDVMVIFADNSPGWVWQEDFYATEREANRAYGVYYHHQLWGSGPHLVQAIPPSKTYEMFSKAYESDASTYGIMNVSNIREFSLGLESSSDMLWNMDGFDAENYLLRWCERRFPQVPKEAYEAYQQFFDSYQLVGDRNIPGFLDGQQKGRGLSILRLLNDQISNPIKYEQRMAQQANRSSDAFGQSLSDTNPARALSLQEVRTQVLQQLENLDQAEKLAEKALQKLEGQSSVFFESNLLAQLKILKGLGHWLVACTSAKLAIESGNMEEAEDQLVQAIAAFDIIQTGKNLASYGKWEDWYRGDKKMNIDNMKKQTLHTLELIRERKP